MSEKRYYWLKLMDNFFRQKEIKKLRQIAGGDTYTIIYQEMMLLSLENGGKLYFDDFGNDIAEEIALELDESVENVKVTISYLMAHGLMTIHGDGNQFVLEKVPSMVGSETSAAERMRRMRERRKINELGSCNDVTAMLQQGTTECNNVTPQLRREDKRREEIDIDIEKDISLPSPLPKEEPKKLKTVKHKYGEYQNVLLSDDELEKLKAEFPNDWEARIERVSSYVASTGKTYKNYLATIRNWARKDGANGSNVRYGSQGYGKSRLGEGTEASRAAFDKSLDDWVS